MSSGTFYYGFSDRTVTVEATPDTRAFFGIEKRPAHLVWRDWQRALYFACACGVPQSRQDDHDVDAPTTWLDELPPAPRAEPGARGIGEHFQATATPPRGTPRGGPPREEQILEDLRKDELEEDAPDLFTRRSGGDGIHVDSDGEAYLSESEEERCPVYGDEQSRQDDHDAPLQFRAPSPHWIFLLEDDDNKFVVDPFHVLNFREKEYRFVVVKRPRAATEALRDTHRVVATGIRLGLGPQSWRYGPKSLVRKLAETPAWWTGSEDGGEAEQVDRMVLFFAESGQLHLAPPDFVMTPTIAFAAMDSRAEVWRDAFRAQGEDSAREEEEGEDSARDDWKFQRRMEFECFHAASTLRRALEVVMECGSNDVSIDQAGRLEENGQRDDVEQKKKQAIVSVGEILRRVDGR